MRSRMMCLAIPMSGFSAALGPSGLTGGQFYEIDCRELIENPPDPPLRSAPLIAATFVYRLLVSNQYVQLLISVEVRLPC